MVNEPDTEALWAAGPPSNMTLRDWLEAMIVLEWRGAAEPVMEISTRADDPPLSVGCVCGTSFTFRTGGIGARAVCPGCGARHLTVRAYGGSV